MTLYSTLFLKPSLRLTRAVGRSENLRVPGGQGASHEKYFVKNKVEMGFYGDISWIQDAALK